MTPGAGHRVARRPARREVMIGYPIDPPVEGAGSVDVICRLGGTLGSPKLIDWATKDI
ncbi:hypothetical protein ACF1AJ_07970 [Leifsonia sp. NPDC014704]|uniref:hypothetical protein n=1 Tax=Leifsonia sp. NPDC014704 TaxID=3364123 RepID=UPI0036F45561